MFNHSPQPNVMFTRVAPRDTETDKYPKLIFRSIKPIKLGDELYICYSADESKLWFSPDYKPGGEHAEQQSEEPTWIPPMVEDDEQTEMPQGEIDSALKDMDPSPGPTPADRDSAALGSDDKKYLDRKARKQSKREKKVKKPKDRGDEKDVAPSAETATDPVAKGSDGPEQQDTPLSLSRPNYEAALAKLGLIPEIAVQDDDVAREEAATKEVVTNGSGSEGKEVAWKLVKRIRGPVEAQEEDASQTGMSINIEVSCWF